MTKEQNQNQNRNFSSGGNIAQHIKIISCRIWILLRLRIINYLCTIPFISNMKSFLSVCAVFVLFQSLMFGSLVKLELPAVYQDKWDETRINTQEPIDIFLRPEQGNNLQNLQNRNHWFPYQFNNAFTNKCVSTSPAVAEIHFKSINRHSYSSIPVFIFTGALRL